MAVFNFWFVAFSTRGSGGLFVEEIMTIQLINSNLTKFTNYIVEYYIISNSTFFRYCGRLIQYLSPKRTTNASFSSF